MKILGIEIERKTDILAFAAFIISISNLILQFFNLVKGPNLTLESPQQVLIQSYSYSANGKKYIRIAAIMNYFNQGSPGYHDIIKSEEAYIKFPNQNKEIKLNAQKYIHSKEKKGELVIETISNAIPVQIKSGDIVSHETLFVPWTNNETNKNFIEYSDFLNLLVSNKEINVRFISSNLKNQKKEVQCKLHTKIFLESLKQKTWSAPVCITE